MKINIIKFSIIFLLTLLSSSNLTAQSDYGGNWKYHNNVNVVYEGQAYKIIPRLKVSNYSVYLNALNAYIGDFGDIVIKGECVPVARWQQTCPDTLGLKHERVRSGVDEHAKVAEIALCDNAHDCIFVKPFTTVPDIQQDGNFTCQEIGDYAYADYDRYYSIDGSKDSIVFQPTMLKSFTYGKCLSKVGRYAFANCKQLDAEIEVSSAIMYGAFLNCRNLSLKIGASCACDIFIGDSLRKVQMKWAVPTYPIFHYVDTLVVPRGCRTAYESMSEDMKAGIIIEGDFDATYSRMRLPGEAYGDTRQTSNIKDLYTFDDPTMQYWCQHVDHMIYKGMTFSVDNYYNPSYLYPNKPYVYNGYYGTLTLMPGWTGRCLDTVDHALIRYAGVLGDNVVVPEHVDVNTNYSDTLILGFYQNDRLRGGAFVGERYVTTKIGPYALADSTSYYSLGDFYHYGQQPETVTYHSLKSLKLPNTIKEIQSFGMAFNYLLREDYYLPNLILLSENSLVGCRLVAIDIPAKCFNQAFVADSLRKVTVHWSAPNNDFPVCQYADTLIVPRGTKELYAGWKNMKAGIIIEGDFDAEGEQPTRTAIEAVANDEYCTTSTDNNFIYDLTGRIVTLPQRGKLYIRNRKKFVW